MKKILLSAAFLMAAFTINAQTTVWSDDFDDEDITNWTTTDEDGDTQIWTVVQVTDNEGNPVGTPLIRSASWIGTPAPDGTNLTPDNWIISPAIDLTALVDGTIIDLDWKAIASDEDWDDETYTVYVGTENTVAALSGSDVTFTETLLGVNELTDRTLDISSFAGETIYVAFRHHDSEGQFTMGIDDVAVVENGVAGITDVLASSLSVYPNPASNVINITSANNVLLNNVQIVDINGRTIKAVSFAGVSEAQISISDLSAGMYMMNLSSDQGMVTKKIVKK